jgi:plasmid maintenance system antidote protein VapI
MAAYFRTESFPAQERITFRLLETRLITIINARIQNGEFTERGLAKSLGISQPHVHNVLKGARKLRQKLADRLLGAFGLSIIDLLDEEERGQCDTAHQAASLSSVANHVPLDSAAAVPRKPPAQEWQLPRRNSEAPG